MISFRTDLRELSKTLPPPKVNFYKTNKGDYAEHDRFLNIPVPLLRKQVKSFGDFSISDIEELIHSPYNEERFCALLILMDKIDCQKILKQDALSFYIKHFEGVNNWNLIDLSAPTIMGGALFPTHDSLFYNWMKSQNLWQRRAAIVATLYYIRKNSLELTYDLSINLFNDHHDLIHKAVGWMLREAGKKDEHRLIHFLKEYEHMMPRTSVRYAKERLKNKQ